MDGELKNLIKLSLSLQLLRRSSLFLSNPTSRWLKPTWIPMASQSSQRTCKGTKRTNHQWTPLEDATLVECCLELIHKGGWSKDNGTFRAGYLQQLEKWMCEKIPNCSIKGSPHIHSRMRLLKSQYHQVSEMLGNAASGFGWDDINKCVTCDLDVWSGWLKGHPAAAGLRNKPLPHYNQLAIIFGKDRAHGEGAESPADAVENIEMEEARAASDALNTLNFFDDDDDLDDIQEAFPFTQTANSASSTPVSMSTAIPDESNTNRKKSKRKKSAGDQSDKDDAFLKNMEKLGEICTSAKDEIGKLAGCFQHLADDAARKMNVYDVISSLGIEDITDEQLVRVCFMISIDNGKTNYLFSIPDNMKIIYVKALLVGSM